MHDSKIMTAKLIYAPLTIIDDNPFQTRLTYVDAEIGELAQSIQSQGLLAPPIARRMPDDTYQLAFGHKRKRALLRLADQQPDITMPLFVRDLDDRAMIRFCWDENRQRSDTTAAENVIAIERYMQALNLNQTGIAEFLEVSRSTVTNWLRLRKLPEPAWDAFVANELSERQAMALLKVLDIPCALWNQSTGSHHVPTAEKNMHGEHERWISTVNELFALAPQIDSTSLRKVIDAMIRGLTTPLQTEWIDVSDGVDGARAARCRDCDLRIGERCFLRSCVALKEAAWKRRQAEAAAAAVGMPAVAIGAYGEYDNLSDVDLPALIQVAQERNCTTLGVGFGRYTSFAHKIPGFDHCGIVCAHGGGPGKHCYCQRVLAKSNDPTVSKKARQRIAKQRIDQCLRPAAERMVVSAFQQPTAASFRVLLHQIDHKRESELSPDANYTDVVAAIGAAIVEEVVKNHYEWQPDAEKAEAALTDLGQRLGYTLRVEPDETNLTIEALLPAPELTDETYETLSGRFQVMTDRYDV